MVGENKQFKKFGHKCQMAAQLDVLSYYIRGDTGFDRFKRILIQSRLISESNPNSIILFKSQGAISEEKHMHMKQHPYMIHPYSDFRKYWEIVIGFVLFGQFLIVPFDLAFVIDTDGYAGMWKVIRWIFDLLFILFVLMNFATGYCDIQNMKSILSPRKIAWRYMRTFFVMDILAGIPAHMEMYLNLYHIKPIRNIFTACGFLKFSRFFHMMKYFEHIYDLLGFNPLTQIFCKFFVLYIIIVNLVNCLLIFFAVEFVTEPVSPNDNNNALEINRNIVLHYPKHLVYIRAYFKGQELFTWNGSGYKYPKHYFQMIVPLITWTVAFCSQVYVAIYLNQALRSTTSSKIKYEGMVSQLKEYMRGRELPKHMQKRLLTYYEFRFQKSYFRESEILATISGQLRQEIILHSCRQLVEKVVFFKNLPLNLLVRITSCLHPEIFLINDVVCYANTTGNCMYFIATGTVSVYTKSGKEIRHLGDGDHFGEVALVHKDQKRIASVVAIEACQLYRLHRHDFVRAISPYPDLCEKIEKIVEERLETTTNMDDRWKALIRSRQE